jgi:hypothetical protein
MSENELSLKSFDFIDHDTNSTSGTFRVAAAGDKSNHEVEKCRVCARNGWPHESIDFQRIPGRMLADGRCETIGWQIRNYYDGNEHRHKERTRD